MIVVFSVSLTTFSTYGQYTDSQEELLNYKNKGIIITDRNGTVFYATHNAKERTFLPLSEISDYAETAILTAEDRGFYSHSGISVPGIVRSIILNIKNNSLSYGGSTITQQLVKNTLLSSERSFSRKYQEALLTILVEQNFSKDEILAMYLNSVYFGDGAVGIDEAAQTFFSKKAKDLSLSESTYLASILKSPNYYSPTSGNADQAKKLASELLERMRDVRVISKDEYEKASHTEIVFSAPVQDHEEQTAYHAALYVISELEKKYGEDVVYDGLKVKTTIHFPWQEFAQEQVSKGVDAQRRNGAGNGAAVVMDPQSGEVLALVGSHNWTDQQNGKINMAISPRSPGSSFKPLVYSLALEKNLITPATILEDERNTFQGDYKPENYDRRFRGDVPVRRALANSLNVPAVEVMEKVGIENVLLNAPEFGITTLGTDTSQYGLSLVLGSGEVPLTEMVGAYSTFANNGIRADMHVISEVEDKFGNIMYKTHPNTTDVISKETAYLISSILSDSRARREVFGNALDTPFPAAVKTGTSENYRDAWTIGYTPNLVVGVWMGNNDNSPMNRVAGSLGAAPIWKNLMGKFVPEKGSIEFKKPDGIVQATVCITTGKSASTSARIYNEYFYKERVPDSERCIRNYTTQLARVQEEENKKEENSKKDKEQEKRVQEILDRIPRIGGIEVQAATSSE